MKAMKRFLFSATAMLFGMAGILAQNNNDVCLGEPTYLYIQAPAGAQLQWQSSPNGTTFSNVANQTGDTLWINNPTVDGFFRVRIEDSGCDPYFTEVEKITIIQPPSAADAGGDINTAAVSINLNATAPANGTGTWTIIAGTGGTIASPNDPQSGFSGDTNGVYTLVWTVENPPCPSTSDTITVELGAGVSLPSITFNNQTIYVHPTDNSGPIAWGCSGVVAGAGDDNDGEANTAAIVQNCTAPTAAHICDNLVAFGFSDWYLPSYNELDEMRNNAAAIGGFSSGNYWSSTEGTGNFTANARYRLFPTGVSGYGSKSNQNRVRCVRK